MPQPVIAVVGPTAAGKSALSLRLAQSLGGEVVNADSMQLYRGMDISTAKLPVGQRDCVPHHLLDIWEVTKAANVSEYQRLAQQAIDGIHSRGKIPVIVGGSGLYVRAVIDNLDFPGTAVRRRARAGAGRRAAGSATPRCCASWTESGRRSKPPPRRSGLRGGSRAARNRGSGGIPGSSGWRPVRT